MRLDPFGAGDDTHRLEERHDPLAGRQAAEEHHSEWSARVLRVPGPGLAQLAPELLGRDGPDPVDDQQVAAHALGGVDLAHAARHRQEHGATVEGLHPGAQALTVGTVAQGRPEAARTRSFERPAAALRIGEEQVVARTDGEVVVQRCHHLHAEPLWRHR